MIVILEVPGTEQNQTNSPTGRYFLWDSVVCLVHFEGFRFVIHGAMFLDSYLFLYARNSYLYHPCFIVLRYRLPVGLPQCSPLQTLSLFDLTRSSTQHINTSSHHAYSHTDVSMCTPSIGNPSTRT
jgi:hypothetical protein